MGDHNRIASGHRRLAVPTDDAALTLGIRPEHIYPAQDGKALPSLNVEQSEQLGGHSLIYGGVHAHLFAADHSGVAV